MPQLGSQERVDVDRLEREHQKHLIKSQRAHDLAIEFVNEVRLSYKIHPTKEDFIQSYNEHYEYFYSQLK